MCIFIVTRYNYELPNPFIKNYIQKCMHPVFGSLSQARFSTYRQFLGPGALLSLVKAFSARYDTKPTLKQALKDRIGLDICTSNLIKWFLPWCFLLKSS